MRFLNRLTMGTTLAASLLSVDIAGAAPLFPVVPGQPDGLIQKTGGIYCDLDGCRTYETRRRIYIDPPPPYYDDDPPIYLERRPPPHLRRVDPSVFDMRRPVMSRRHVEWCLDRYRSYDPRTNLYLARRNVFRQCISPWS